MSLRSFFTIGRAVLIAGYLAPVALVGAPTLVLGCAKIEFAAAPGPGGGTGGTAPTDARADMTVVDLHAPEIGGPAICGNGQIDVTAGENCDDGNAKSGDGCSSDCTAIEKDFACPTPNRPCVYLVKCGDGILGGTERCDPPNVGTGCSADCQLESGYICDPPAAGADPTQPAKCHKTVCGDNNKEGSEACDDGNLVDGDGCGASCTLEPDCSSGHCVSKCGDNVKLPPEACDDGNTKDGDGCSADCKSEVGFSCTDTSLNLPSQLNLLVTYRDFISFPLGGSIRHPDFEIFSGMGLTPQLVSATLDANGKPVMDGRCAQAGISAMCPYDQQLTTQTNFDQWYHDSPGVNVKVPGALLLPRLANGSYVFDSANRGFYPIDGKGWTAAPVRESTAIADPIVNDGRAHNFGFTTELRTFFQYRGGESLTFSGDDDVWIFLNRGLALDLGGLHTSMQRTLIVDQSAATLGLTVGGLYEIVLFHAERHSAGSNFKLTLTGFAPTSTTCRSACGDGVTASSEQCDDGNTVDGDGCSHDCKYEIVIR